MNPQRVKVAWPLVALVAVVAAQIVNFDGVGTFAGASTPHLMVSTGGGDFGTTGVGNYTGGVPGQDGNAGVFTLTNDGGSTDTIDLSTGAVFTGTPGDWVIVASRGGTQGCPGTGSQIVLTASASCVLEVSFHPSTVGFQQVTLTITGSDNSSVVQHYQGTGYQTLDTSTAPNPINFVGATLGTYVGPSNFTLSLGPGHADDTINLATGLSFSGPGADDYTVSPSPNCDGDGVNTVVLTGYDTALPPPASASCVMHVSFFPGALGDRSATMTIQGSIGMSLSIPLEGTGQIGYYQVDEFGDVANYGDAAWYGDAGNDSLNSPIVGMAATGDDGGYWLVAADGGIFNYGPSAQFHGSAGGIRLNKPIVGMAATPDGAGYWLVATDGGIFSYGDAPFFGSTGAIALNRPIVGMAADPLTGGYWLVASDGGIFAYNAPFYGSTGSIRLNKPIVGMVAAPGGNGYWMVASDGGIFAFGPGAPFYGSTGSLSLAQPITSMAAMPDGSGYWFSAADGGLFSYRAPFYGSGTNDPNLDIVVDMVTDGSPTAQTLLNIPAMRAGDTAHAVAHAKHFAGAAPPAS